MPTNPSAHSPLRVRDRQSQRGQLNRPHILRRGVAVIPLGFLVASLFSLALIVPSVGATSDTTLAEAQAYLDRGQAQKALGLIERALASSKPSAEALLMRSTAYIMTGNAALGFKDLKRALKIDPTLRQGWLNLAGLEIIEKRYDEATKALLKARELDREAPDTYLNLGAVAMLQGRTAAATENFQGYLERAEDIPEAHYLIAANYALGSQAALAVEHLGAAIERDERYRLRARSDDRFAALVSSRYTELLNSDSYRPPPDAHTVSAAFSTPYRRDTPRLLYAVLDAMKELGERYEPKIEATRDWALVWGDMRIKVWNQSNGTGVLSLSAPAQRFTADDWHRRTQALFQAVYRILSAPEVKPRMRPPGQG